MPCPSTRRHFLRAAAASAVSVPCILTSQPGLSLEARNDRPAIGCIGLGSRWRGVGWSAAYYGPMVAFCDVDSRRVAAGQNRKDLVDKLGERKGYDDYRKVLDRKDIEVVTIVTPDHWHTKIAIEAMQAGKHVYCEKPLTLTIDEGKQICRVVRKTGKTLQVGTQQRSEMRLVFLKAVALAKSGRLGKIRKVTVAIGGAPARGNLPKVAPPKELNWNMWLGQAPLVDYIERRCHYEFRWWYEYSGGKMTDWGAHHVDIATWAIGMDQSGPASIEPLAVEHPVPLKNGHPTLDNAYNTANSFQIRILYPNGIEMLLCNSAPGVSNGIIIEGSRGTIQVNRKRLTGKPAEELAENPLPEGTLTRLYGGKKPGNHFFNFFECIKDGTQPISDVFTHHRALTTCHLANIAIRLGRRLNWNPETEQIIGDDAANTWQSRPQRKGFEIKA